MWRESVSVVSCSQANRRLRLPLYQPMVASDSVAGSSACEPWCSRAGGKICFRALNLLASHPSYLLPAARCNITRQCREVSVKWKASMSAACLTQCPSEACFHGADASSMSFVLYRLLEAWDAGTLA
jgi:hypothetical protein